MRRLVLAVLAVAAALLAFRSLDAKEAPDLRAQVFAAENGFAHTMEARDFAGFGRFVSEEAVFFGQKNILRGRAEIVAGWKSLFDGAKAPFAWKPEVVEVLPSGTLALSTGPVWGEDGKVFGRFQSIWRLEADGRWRVVFDKGCAVCDSAQAK